MKAKVSLSRIRTQNMMIDEVPPSIFPAVLTILSARCLNDSKYWCITSIILNFVLDNTREALWYGYNTDFPDTNDLEPHNPH